MTTGDEKEIVDASETETTTETVTEPSSKPEAVSEETKEERRNAYNLRQERKRWRDELSRARDGEAVTEEDIAAAQELARKQGFDLDDDKKKQIDLIAKVADEVVSRKSERVEKKSKEVLVKHSRENLKNTLLGLGYSENTKEYSAAGNLIWKHFGVDDPDAFSDQDEVAAVLDDYVNSLKPKKGNSVDDEIMRKSGAPKPTGSSGRSKGSEDPEIKRLVQTMGISEEKAKTIMEKQKNLPSFMRKK